MTDEPTRILLDDIGVKLNPHCAGKFRCGHPTSEPNEIDSLPLDLPGCHIVAGLLTIAAELEGTGEYAQEQGMVDVVREGPGAVVDRARDMLCGIPLTPQGREQRLKRGSRTPPAAGRNYDAEQLRPQSGLPGVEHS